MVTAFDERLRSMKPSIPCDKKDLFETACEAVLEAGRHLRKYFGKQKEIAYKSRIDPVTNVDLASEETIIRIIKSRHPGHDIITEESHIALSGSPFRWIIDPLDGTVNYAHDFPIAAVSVALEINGSLEIGIVYNPLLDELFTACRGEGAFYNNGPIHVSETIDLEKSFLATGFPYNIRESSCNLPQFNRLIRCAQAVRRIGSAALDACYCAMGRFDGYWEITISPWDIAAGTLIVREAGGKVTNLKGEELSIYDNQIVASNGRIHDRLLDEIVKGCTVET
jgi:myo-inositol-1(or 4)-monophosphatase